jgi:hypothetical protein
MTGRERRVLKVTRLTDAVEKVENRKTPKISRKSIFRHCCYGKVLRGQYEGRWSFLYESMWVLRSPRTKRISGLQSLRTSPEKDFFDSIDPNRTLRFRHPED